MYIRGPFQINFVHGKKGLMLPLARAETVVLILFVGETFSLLDSLRSLIQI